MSRAERLLRLIAVLRRYRYAVSGAVLASELGVSLRTLYRDIATLQAQGARIEGAAGLGYVLRPGFLLPPLMFAEEEIEALILGSRWVMDRADFQLAGAARDALAKIAAVLPENLRDEFDSAGFLVGPGKVEATRDEDLIMIRQAIRQQRKLLLDYADVNDSQTQRTIWPFALGFFDQVRIVMAWCELRQGFRHFRVDRIRALEPLEMRYPKHRRVLLKEWRVCEGIALSLFES